jgi:nucleotide-binding universal stress UspA family protein
VDERRSVMSYNERDTVVVGIDGSSRSVPVLEWAAEYAATTDAEVKVVTAWHVPEVLGHRPARAEADLSATRERIVEELADRTCHAVTHHTVIQEDAAAQLLLREAKDADVLVVGAHGRGDTPRLGSVTMAVLLHAQCPVVVVPVGP